MSMNGLKALAFVCVLLATFIVISDESKACFSWEVECQDWTNGVDEGYYTTYKIEVSLRPGCRRDYWLYFWPENVPQDWDTRVLDMDGHQIFYNHEFFLTGTVTYIFTFKVEAPDTVTLPETAYITLYIRADDRYN